MLLGFLEILAVLFLGLVLGSFATALIYRVPRKKKWWGTERSFCPSCKHKLAVLDLIPFFSWCISGGKCRYCKTSISVHYPLVEAFSALSCFAAYLVLGLNVESLFIIIAVPFLLSLFFIDLEKMILPDQLSFIVLVIGLLRLFYFSLHDVFSKASDLFVPYILGAFIYAGLIWFCGYVMEKSLKKKTLGMGDVKFFFVAGIWLGLYNLQYFLILSGLIGVVFALFWKIFKKNSRFPFGPSLIISFFVLLLIQGSFLF